MSKKRRSGQVNSEKNWLVITESTRIHNGWLHDCETVVQAREVPLSHRDSRFGGLSGLTGSGTVVRLEIPYCPNCESVPPDSGVYCEGEFQLNFTASESV